MDQDHEPERYYYTTRSRLINLPTAAVTAILDMPQHEWLLTGIEESIFLVYTKDMVHQDMLIPLMETAREPSKSLLSTTKEAGRLMMCSIQRASNSGCNLEDLPSMTGVIPASREKTCT